MRDFTHTKKLFSMPYTLIMVHIKGTVNYSDTVYKTLFWHTCTLNITGTNKVYTLFPDIYQSLDITGTTFTNLKIKN